MLQLFHHGNKLYVLFNGFSIFWNILTEIPIKIITNPAQLYRVMPSFLLAFAQCSMANNLEN